jgi:hypothetical protein
VPRVHPREPRHARGINRWRARCSESRTPGSEGGCAEKAWVHDPRTPDLAAQPTLPGYDLITAILQAGGHVIARVKDGISLPFDGPDRGWLPDGSRMTWLNVPSGKKQDRLPVRAAEHNVVLPSGDGKEEPS